MCRNLILCVPVFKLVLAPGPWNPINLNLFRTLVALPHISDRLFSVTSPHSANDPSPEQYVDNCSHIGFFGA